MERWNVVLFLFSRVASSSLLSCGSAWTLFWLGKVVSFKKKKIFVFVFFFSPVLSCSLGWTFHQCYSEYRSFSSEAISRIFGSSEDKTSPQIRQCCATGKTLPPSRLTLPFPAYLKLVFFTNVTPRSVFQRSALTQGIDKNLILKATWELKILIVCYWTKIL